MKNDLAVLGGNKACAVEFPRWPQFDHTEEEALLRVLRSGEWGIGGTEVGRFAANFANYQDAEYALPVMNGSVSLRIALMAAGVEAGEEVIVPPFTFLATATSVIEANATPIFADIDPETFNLSPDAIQAAITPNTKAIIVVHLGGLAADMDAILAIAKQHSLIVIEDSAHAHGAEYKGRKVGAIGHMGSFSFQSTKNLTSGEGGCIVSDNEEFIDTCWTIHNCGRSKNDAWYEHAALGGNYRISEFQAAILNCQIARLDQQVKTREENGKYLSSRLEQLPGITPQLRKEENTVHSYHIYVFKYDERVYSAPRETFLAALAAEGVPVCAGYTVPLFEQPLFTEKRFFGYTGYRATRPDLDYGKCDCPVTQDICKKQGAWLAQNVLLGSRSEMEKVADTFEKVYENRNQLHRREGGS